jgi:hypothetical protein
MSAKAQAILEEAGEGGFPARTEYFTDAELAGLIQSATSSFARGSYAVSNFACMRVSCKITRSEV